MLDSSPACDTMTLSDFAGFGLKPQLERAVSAAGYDTPRPIQAQTIPAALEGRDILGLAQTGTGKTVAFGLPILQRLLKKPTRRTRILVVAPTRELALQIDGELRKLAKFTRLSTVTIFGGVSENPQIQKLRRQPDIIVACPGRLLDLLRQGHLRLDAIEALVLDEADHMFDMGFLPDLRRIIAALPERRQNLLFAATMPREIRELAEQLLQKPAIVELAHSMPAETIRHTLFWVEHATKLDLLCYLLEEDGCTSAIVFTRTRHRARRLARTLEKNKYRAVALHGDLSQSARDRAMDRFRRGKYDLLVATDVAARGIDVDQVSHVINFDAPDTPDAYTHRIGRTGRSERNGTAFTFATIDDTDVVRAIDRLTGTKIARSHVRGLTIPEPKHRPSAARNGQRQSPHGGRARSGRSSSGTNTHLNQTRRPSRKKNNSAENREGRKRRSKNRSPRRSSS